MADPDFLGLNEDTEAAQLPPGLVTGAKLSDNALHAADFVNCRANAPEFIGASNIVFVEDDGEMSTAHATLWRQWMAQAGYVWNRLPTVSEVEKFKQYQQAKLLAANWSLLRQAQARDDAVDAAVDKAEMDKAEQGRKPGHSLPFVPPGRSKP
jgi:hypothetical protein